MKKYILGVLIFTITNSLTVLAMADVTYSEKSQVNGVQNQLISLANLTEERVADFFSGKSSEIFLECPEGMILPLKLFLKSEFIALMDDFQDHSIKILKTFFIKATGETLFFSVDFENWYEFEDFFNGKIEISLNTREKNPSINCNVELNSLN